MLRGLFSHHFVPLSHQRYKKIAPPGLARVPGPVLGLRLRRLDATGRGRSQGARTTAGEQQCHHSRAAIRVAAAGRGRDARKGEEGEEARTQSPPVILIASPGEEERSACCSVEIIVRKAELNRKAGSREAFNLPLSG